MRLPSVYALLPHNNQAVVLDGADEEREHSRDTKLSNVQSIYGPRPHPWLHAVGL